jgi:heat shock protein HslJ
MPRALVRHAFFLATLAAVGLTAQAVAAKNQPVLEYVRPGAEVTFVSKLEPPRQEVDGWSFMIERWSEFTVDEIQDLQAAGNPISLAFADGQLSGSGPCNSLFGTYTLEDGALRFGSVGRSKKMCANADVMAMEDKLLAFLSKVERMERIGPTLVLRTADDAKMSLWGAETSEPAEGNGN